MPSNKVDIRLEIVNNIFDCLVGLMELNVGCNILTISVLRKTHQYNWGTHIVNHWLTFSHILAYIYSWTHLFILQSCECQSKIWISLLISLKVTFAKDTVSAFVYVASFLCRTHFLSLLCRISIQEIKSA